MRTSYIEEDLKKSGLSWDVVKRYGWHKVRTAEELKKLIGFARIDGQDIIQACDVVAIPYPGTNFTRIRLYPPLNGLKYIQPKGTPYKPYILPAVASMKNKPHKPLIITEGEKKAIALVENGFNAIGLPGVWQFKNSKQGFAFLPELDEFVWINRTTYICFDSDAVYNVQVLSAEIELALNLYARGALVYIVRLPQPNHKEKMGVDDFIAEHGTAAFEKLYNSAVPFFQAYFMEFYNTVVAVVKRLINNGTLSHAQVDFVVKAFAKRWRVKTINIRKDLNINSKDEDSTEPIVEEIEPFNGEVDGVELYEEIKGMLENCIYMSSEHYYVAITLWILLTYVYDKFSVLPQLLLTSPTKRCGKTATLTVIEALANRSLMVSNISPAALFRVIEEHKPTLLIDEADESTMRNDEIVGILNAGHTKRTAFVIRADKNGKGEIETSRFNTFCPKAIAMIGVPKSTQVDRSIVIKMDRKPPHIELKKIAVNFFENMKPIRAKLKKWAQDVNIKTPEVKLNLQNDRAEDNWYPLLSIAFTLNDEIMEEAIAAAKYIAGSAEDEDERERLLRDILSYFETKGTEKARSKWLVEYLNELEDAPWSDKRGGKGITTAWLANKLKLFGIKPKTIRDGFETFKGYALDDIVTVCDRYIQNLKSNTVTMASGRQSQQVEGVENDENVTFLNSQKMASERQCYDVTACDGNISDNIPF